MSIPEFNDLFHDSGAQGILGLLFAKFEANNLSQDEALAMLSAVHEVLGQGTNTDPKLYQLYSNFLKLLQRDNPDIYNYVVSTWNQRKGMQSADSSSLEEYIVADDTIASKSQNIEIRADEGFIGVKQTGGEAKEEGEVQEPGETEEGETSEVEKLDENNDESATEAADDETEGDENDEKKENKEDQEESKDEDLNDQEGESETGEAREESSDEAGDKSEFSEDDTEANENTEPGEEPDEPTTETEKGEPEGETKGETKGEDGEAEWPEIGESSTEEPLEGFEGDEGPTPAVD